MSEPAMQELLSLKATAGFLSRTRRAKLRFAPGFITAVERHLDSMGGSVQGVVPAHPQLDLLAA
jgi:DNA (cytosine-5)-methyltransferase 1